MAAIVYFLGFLTTLACAVLLLRAYARVKLPLLLWSGLCFVGLTFSNALLPIDLMLFPGTDLYAIRLGCAAVSMGLLLYGLIWESE